MEAASLEKAKTFFDSDISKQFEYGCLKCHVSYEKLAARTDKNDINPHDSHLENLDCGACHHGHKKPVLACDECHEFTNIKVP